MKISLNLKFLLKKLYKKIKESINKKEFYF
jgi:hypothetical protein